MNHKQLGVIPSARPGARDAFHVAGVLVTCDKPCVPGDFLVVAGDKAVQCSRENRNAIVDPFLKEAVPPGTVFWALIVPEEVESLTHKFVIKGEAIGDHITIKEDYRECAGMGCSIPKEEVEGL